MPSQRGSRPGTPRGSRPNSGFEACCANGLVSANAASRSSGAFAPRDSPSRSVPPAPASPRSRSASERASAAAHRPARSAASIRSSALVGAGEDASSPQATRRPAAGAQHDVRREQRRARLSRSRRWPNWVQHACSSQPAAATSLAADSAAGLPEPAGCGWGQPRSEDPSGPAAAEGGRRRPERVTCGRVAAGRRRHEARPGNGRRKQLGLQWPRCAGQRGQRRELMWRRVRPVRRFSRDRHHVGRAHAQPDQR